MVRNTLPVIEYWWNSIWEVLFPYFSGVLSNFRFLCQLICLSWLFLIDISTPLPDHEMSYNTVYGQFVDFFLFFFFFKLVLTLQATHPVIVYSFHP